MTRHATASSFLGAAGVIAMLLLAGCNSKEQKALRLAKARAIASNVPQQVQFINDKGDTVTETVEPPVSRGQQPAVTTLILPPPPGTKPHSTNPVVTALPSAAQMAPPPQYGSGPQYGSAPQYGSSPQYNSGLPYGSNPQYNSSAAAPPQPGPGVYPPSGPAGPPPIGTPPLESAAPVSVRIPPGTDLTIRIDQHLSSRGSYAGERFDGNVYAPVVFNGEVVIPAGTPVRGQVMEAHHGGHFRGRSVLDIRLTTMKLNGYVYPLPTHDDVFSVRGKGRRSAGIIGGMTGAGMLIGGLATGGVGLAIGAAAGAGSGTAIAATTGNHNVEIPSEAIVHFRLANSLTLSTP
jgi:outer membrane murein-binding lipoprotein Lpp